MRRDNDFYPTPEWATAELLKHVAISGAVLECCAGAGDMAKVLALHGQGHVYCNDIDPTTMWPNHWDAANPSSWYDYKRRWTHDPLMWVVTNPPFNVASQIVPLAYEHATDGIAMLLRLSYLEPTKDRGEWLNAHPPTTLIVLPRISFTGDGKTDNVTCAWMVWEKSQVAKQRIVVAENPKFVRAVAKAA